MKVKILGAHNTESRQSKMTCLLIDNILALDAGGLTSNLSFRDQMKIKAVFLTHAHYDHIRDIPALAMNLYLRNKSVTICTHQAVVENITRYFLNDITYPEFHKRPPENPTLKITILEPYQDTEIEVYRIMSIPVTHALPAMGYQIKAKDGKTIFYTGDTGTNLTDIWQHISPQYLFTELTAPNRWEAAMNHSGHLTPNLLQKELLSFQERKGYLPQVVLIHLNPLNENEIASEIAVLENSLGVSIRLAHEEMQIRI